MKHSLADRLGDGSLKASATSRYIRLGVNIDHVATVRQARGEVYPDPVHAAFLAELGGADNITCHLREDRRHVQDRDVEVLSKTIGLPLNFEMAATEEMLAFALKIKPHAVTLVPEKREERTTEGGLDVARSHETLRRFTDALQSNGILVSLFVEPEERVVEICSQIGAGAVEFHTGTYCKAVDQALTSEAKWEATKPLVSASRSAHAAGLQVHFGHGLHYQNAQWLQVIPFAEEANIGHAIVARALYVGFTQAVKEMKELLNNPVHRPFFVDKS